MRIQVLVMLTAAVLLQAGQASAEIYKWVDENGQVHYSDRATAPAADKVTVQAAPPSQPQRTPAASGSAFPVTPEEQQDAVHLQMEYQQRRDEENARQYQEQEAKRLKDAEHEKAKRKQEAEAQEQARRKAVIEECKATMRLRICSKGYDAIMAEKERLRAEGEIAGQKARMNDRYR